MAREIRITPSILNADRNNLQSEITRIAEESDLIHLDVMDNIFVPNFTFDFDRATEIIRDCPIPVDAHLMVAEVDESARAYAQAGAASVTIHVEATRNVKDTAKAIRRAGARAAIALKPKSRIEDYADFLGEVDMVLIMTVEPGFGGQQFMSEMLPKVEAARKLIGDRPIWLQVDGGISLETIEQAATAGADTFVAGSAVFRADDPAAMIRALRSAVLE